MKEVDKSNFLEICWLLSKNNLALDNYHLESL